MWELRIVTIMITMGLPADIDVWFSILQVMSLATSGSSCSHHRHSHQPRDRRTLPDLARSARTCVLPREGQEGMGRVCSSRLDVSGWKSSLSMFPKSLFQAS